MVESEKRKVRVACRVSNGIMLRLYKQAPAYMGETLLPDGAGVRLSGPSSLHTGAGSSDRRDLQPGITEIDADWWSSWLAQNPGDKNQMVGDGLIYAVEENPTQP